MNQQTSAATETRIKGNTIIDFTGKTLYVGIDVHQKDYQVAIILPPACWCFFITGLNFHLWHYCRTFIGDLYPIPKPDL